MKLVENSKGVMVSQSDIMKRGSGGGSGMSELEKRVQRIEDTMATRDHIHELSLEIKDIKVELHKEISMLSRLLVSALFAVAGVMIAVMKLF